MRPEDFSVGQSWVRTAVVMLVSLATICAVGYGAFSFVDLESESALYARFLPFVVFLSLSSFCIWVVVLLHHLGIRQTFVSSWHARFHFMFGQQDDR